jgi:short-subunit dehydrogenase
VNTEGAAKEFQGKTVIITGASSGLGEALAEGFAAAGANLLLFARSIEELERVGQNCRGLGAKVHVVAGDVTAPMDCLRLLEEAERYFSCIDILVACAGIGMWSRFDEVGDPRVLARVMDVNYQGVVNAAFYGLPHLKKSRGVFAAISSVQGKVGVPYHTGYAASKHAVQGFCDSLRMELRGSGVSVLTVIAHWIRGTDLRERALGGDGAPRGKSSHAHGSGAVPVSEMAKSILEAIGQRKREVFVPGKLRYLSWLWAIAPTLAERIISSRVNREAKN